MSKKALVFKTSDIFSNPAVIKFSDLPDNLHTALMSREHCETDPNYQQIIPYIALRDAAWDVDKFFVYTRGEKGDEGRLHGKCSIGLGGHVESEVAHSSTLQDLLVDETIRELEEEIGLRADEETADHIESRLKDAWIVHLTEDAVSSVHTGIMYVVDIDSAKLGQLEEGVITKGEWLTLEEIQAKVAAGEIELELWTEFFVNQILIPEYEGRKCSQMLRTMVESEWKLKVD